MAKVLTEDEARRIASNIAWYLDDLVLTPVNHLTSSERKAKWLTAQNSLADRIAEYQPLAIVIQRIVEAAAIAAGSNVALRSVSCAARSFTLLLAITLERMQGWLLKKKTHSSRGLAIDAPAPLQ